MSEKRVEKKIRLISSTMDCDEEETHGDIRGIVQIIHPEKNKRDNIEKEFKNLGCKISSSDENSPYIHYRCLDTDYKQLLKIEEFLHNNCDNYD